MMSNNSQQTSTPYAVSALDERDPRPPTIIMATSAKEAIDRYIQTKISTVEFLTYVYCGTDSLQPKPSLLDDILENNPNAFGDDCSVRQLHDTLDTLDFDAQISLMTEIFEQQASIAIRQFFGSEHSNFASAYLRYQRYDHDDEGATLHDVVSRWPFPREMLVYIYKQSWPVTAVPLQRKRNRKRKDQ